MKLVFRADSSATMGSGHLMRCLALAEKLRQGNTIYFISRNLPNNVNYLVEEYGFHLLELPFTQATTVTLLQVTQEQDAQEVATLLRSLGPVERLFVDHYAIDAKWEEQLLPLVKRLCVIDDTGDRRHHCHLLFDSSTEDGVSKYAGLVNEDCHLIFGRRYQLFRNEFLQQRQQLLEHRGPLRKLLLSFGGSDPTGELLRLIPVLTLPKYRQLEFTLIAGGANKNYERLKTLCTDKSNIILYRQVQNMAELLNATDACLGAAGGSVWERVFLGVPSISVSVADNQNLEETTWDRSKPYLYVGNYKQLDARIYEEILDYFLAQPQELVALAKRAGAFFHNYEQQVAELRKLILEDL